MNDEVTLGEWLRDARMDKDVSLRALAAELEIAPSYLSDIENDRRIPAEDVLQRLTAAVGLDLDEAMARAGRFGEKAERYMRRQPEAVRLMRRISTANLTAEQLRNIWRDVETRNEESDQK